MIQRALACLVVVAAPAGLRGLPAAEPPVDPPALADCEADVRAWLDARAAARVGPVLLEEERFTRKLDDGRLQVSQYWGRVPMLAYRYFDAHDLLGDAKSLRVALDLTDYYLRIQEPEGFWHYGHLVSPSGEAAAMEPREGPGVRHCRLQDTHQSGCFRLMLYAWKATGEKKYFESARRCADYVLSIQNENGSWPDYWIPGTKKEGRTAESTKAGMLIGGSYNDHATSDPMAMMIVMYHLTKDPRYVARIPRIGQWIFDTQLGQSKVRGWCQQYGLDNKPHGARHFEMPVIELRTFSRFIAPLCAQLYVLSGDERYVALMRETVDWVKSVERPGPQGGWAYQYLPDGTEVFSTGGQVYRYDQPDTWPKPLPAKGGAPTYSRDNGGTGEAELYLERHRAGGREALRALFAGPVRLAPDEMSRLRASAAAWCADAQTLRRVRERPLRACSSQWDLDRGGNTGKGGEIEWQFLLKSRIAQGRFTPEQLAPGAPPHWGGQGFHAVKVECWLDIPWTKP